MGFRQAIRMALDEYYEDLKAALDGLSAEERRFQPGPEVPPYRLRSLAHGPSRGHLDAGLRKGR